MLIPQTEKKVADYLRRVDIFPVVSCHLRCPCYEGWADVIRAPIKFASVLVGNIPGVRNPNGTECSLSPADARNVSSHMDSATLRPAQDGSPLSSANFTLPRPETASPEPELHPACAVQTSAGKMKSVHPLAVPALQPLFVTPDDFSPLQASCDTRSTARAKATSGEIE